MGAKPTGAFPWVDPMMMNKNIIVSLAAAAAFHCSKFILWLADDGFDFLAHITDSNSPDRDMLSVDLSQKSKSFIESGVWCLIVQN